ncbi:MAG TPA: hypothetical protein VKM54_19015 [Myxococcota bacterium]|nr:hypothetical protein [Myxococcota bacterium]
MPCSAIVVFHLFLAIIYIRYPSYFDHAEANIASVAGVVARGGVIYHAADDAARYSTLYGPLTYLVPSLSLRLFGAHLWASKLPGVLALIATIVAFVGALIRVGVSGIGISVATAILSVILLYFGHMSFWVRSDPFILLLVTTCILVASSPGRWTAFVIGLVGGVLFAFKLTAPLYVVPFFLSKLAQSRSIQVPVYAALGFWLPVAAIFALPEVALANYLYWLRAGAVHGIDFSLFFDSLQFSMIYLVPIALLSLLYWGNLTSEDRAFVVGLLASIVAVDLVTAKPGSGPHHLLPFAPMTIVFGLRVVAAGGKRLWWHHLSLAGVVACAVIAVAPRSYEQAKSILSQMLNDWRFYASIEAELSLVQRDHPLSNIQMGYGALSSYTWTFTRPSLVYWGNDYLLDAAAMMDFKESGLHTPKLTILAMTSCEKIWLIPRNERPFSMRTYYWFPNGVPLFDESLQSAFTSAFRIVQRYPHFDVWGCREH